MSPHRKGEEILLGVTHTGVCHTDAYTLEGSDPEGVFPVVLGHEGAGIVVEVGEGVTNVVPGDHVIPLYTAECGKCDFCLSGKTNLCVAVRETQGKGLMPDGTTRFSYNGQPLYHYMGCSTFSEYTVVAEVSLAKINPEANPEHVCLLGCGVTTGIGSPQYRQGPAGDHRRVGLGGISLRRFRVRARRGGSHHRHRHQSVQIRAGTPVRCDRVHQPQDHDKPIQQVLIEMTGWGIDQFRVHRQRPRHARRAESAHRGWGQAW